MTIHVILKMFAYVKHLAKVTFIIIVVHQILFSFSSHKNKIESHPWAPAGMSRGGTCPWKCCKVFCALAVTVKRSVTELFMHYFHNFLDGRSGSFTSFGICFEGND